MNSIKAKLGVIVITLFIFALSLLAGLNFWQAEKIIIQDVETELAGKAQGSAVQIGGWLDSNKRDIATLARSPIITSGTRETIVPYLNTELSNAKIYESLIWVDEKGNYVDYNGETGTLAERDYFQRSIKGEAVVSDPVVSKKTDKLVVAISTPVRFENRITGVLVALINIGEIEKIVLELKAGDTGYAYVIRGDGIIIVHPNKELVNKVSSMTDPNAPPELISATEKMTKGELGIVSYGYLGTTKYLAYAPIPGYNWSIGVNVPSREVKAKLNAFTWTSLTISLIVLLIAAIIVLIVATKIATPLKKLKDAAEGIAAGDISLMSINISSKDEMGHLAHAFEMMVGNLRGLVQQINGSSEQVAASSQELTANAEQLAQVAGQVSTSVTSTAQGIGDQVAVVDKALVLVEKIASGAHEEAIKTGNVIDITAKAVSAATEGNHAVVSAISQMNNIRQTVEHSAQVVAELGEQSKEIGQIVDTISGIAGQTNLLALNAAIEAARAGEQGRGFAVVAEEVRKLAEQSQAAAKQIATLIGDIQSKTDKAVITMANGTQEVKKGSDVVDQAGKAFTDIDLHINKVASIAQAAADGMQQLAASSQQVVESMKEVETFSREISSQTQSISAATEEQLASMEEISASSHHLAQLAEQLQGAVAKFKM
ncbi:Methyl-accepting chemotaxis protein McpA [Sporomusa ovata DSM 2662]|uniref:Methyl-accepting chemotaxis protein n=1 Tax=Sporomusa ovata TaxID=2378 RepID=A0A0U1KU06_9FIRM|nr:methyl-accepting chemotaxis protein [Sporomusa ovata]EQB26806.1 methyl-accepting chemotaxis protein McpA [Sporomusa ovata DSM 2662]CQR70906.1 Methyl-accepting chemotaxis protein [Sporomusa ovata]